jgi:C-terminal processing protease CtpA/Prc
MKNVNTLLSLLCLLIVVRCTAQPQTGTSYNLDMEIPDGRGMPAGWIARTPKDTTISADSLVKLCHIDTAVRQQGKSSILLDRTDVAGWTVVKTIITKAFGGQKIKLTGYLKSEDLAGGAGLWLRIDGAEKVLEFDNMMKRAVTGTTDWTEYTIELNYDGKNAKSIVAGAQMMGTGKVWVDNLHITIDGVDISQAPAYSALTSYNLDVEMMNEAGLPTGWGLGNIRDAGIPEDTSLNAYRADKEVKQHGNYSLLIDWTVPHSEWTATNYVIRRSFAGKTIKLKGYLKTENVAESAGLWLRIDGVGRPLEFDNMHDRPVQGTTDWKEYTIELDYDGKNAKQIVFGGLIVGKGKLWMDNLHLTIDGVDINEAALYEKSATCKADLDTAFNRSSGISSIGVTEGNLVSLANLGMLWGFLKYYHANVGKGDFNMDAELFRVLPKVIAAKSKAEANQVMDKWVDIFGKPEVCKKCDKIEDAEDVKLAPDYGFLFDKGNLPETLQGKLNYIKRNRLKANESYYIKMAEGVGNPVFQNEYAYAASGYPDAGIRLLAAYRYWNMIQYFFPDRHLIGEDWNNVLRDVIPDFCNAGDTLSYQLACLKLIARIHDTHANLWGGADALRKMKGENITPFQAKFVEHKLVVAGYYQDVDGIKDKVHVGDVIEAINNTSVDSLIAKYLPLTPASNYETQLRDLPGVMGPLMRTASKSMQVTISRDGKKQDFAISTVPVTMEMRKVDLGTNQKEGYRMLDGNIGYIYPAKLKENDLDKIKEEFAATDGIVIDMRCYPSTFMTFTYGAWLKPTSSPFVKFTNGSTDMPGMIKYGVTLQNGGGIRKHYKGKLVIIVDAKTQSSAEYQTMALSTAPGARVIGSTTAGADGNVSEIILPGGLRTMISGIGILYPDGSETQRKGVRIDREVRPTIKGIREGRDEVLEEAIRMVKG